MEMENHYSKIGNNQVKHILIIFTIFFIGSTGIFAEESSLYKVLIVEGKGAGETDYGLSQAIDDALKNSVSTYINSFHFESGKSMSEEKFEVLLARRMTYVKQFFIMEKSIRPNNVLEIKVKVYLDLEKLNSDLKALDLCASYYSKPSISVVVREVIENQVSDKKFGGLQIINTLSEDGYQTFGPFDFLIDSEEKKISSLPNNGADLTIFADINVSETTQKLKDGTYKTYYQAEVNLKIYRNDFYEDVFTVETINLQTNSDKQKAIENSIYMAVAEASTDLLKKLKYSWEEIQKQDRDFTIELNFKSEDDCDNFEKEVLKSIDVLDMQHIYNIQSKAKYNVKSTGTVNNLKQVIDKSEDYKVKNISKNQIEVVKDFEVEEISYENIEYPPIDLKSIEMPAIFPTQYKIYSISDCASLSVINNSNSEMHSIIVSIILPEFMVLPSQKVIDSVPPSKHCDLRMGLEFNGDKILDVIDSRDSQAKISVEYYYKGMDRKKEFTIPVAVMSRNAINWQKFESVAAYVTNLDPVIGKFSRMTTELNCDYVNQPDIEKVFKIYSAVIASGVRYVSDPLSTYRELSFDHVYYPRETLENRCGDCEDLSIMFAAMYENIGGVSGLVQTPNHLFFLAGLNILPKDRLSVHPDINHTVLIDDKVFIPFETTFLNGDFLGAWDKGAEIFYSANIESIIIREAWRSFPPVILPKDSFYPELDIGKANEMLSVQKKDYQKALQENINTSYKLLYMGNEEKRKGIEILCRWGLSSEIMDSVISIGINNFNHPTIMNNIGNLYLMEGKFELAKNAYDFAITFDKSPGLNLNRGILFYLVGDLENAKREIKIASESIGGVDQILKYIGFNLEEENINEDESEERDSLTVKESISEEEFKKLIELALNKIPDTKSGESQELDINIAGRRGFLPKHIKNLPILLYWSGNSK